ncbi:unnamed protein product (macronuclear) [Paramecium tetraurelia]|uniref:Lebercilin domain-containing protein n=1 Tax=Paramecium tetraurelia TaxID=5888 RepID=A0D667_PARTE|nr:uncharacterized protein GSPATT00013964001 [Paramecium tetraurelia]CAK78534.1 unnamed protein product [Paramecium tetraurelia]|eukprot:XP_001445931.1 hypothetical protein (macronuclear) [Paramecium tetraurelia strain d4-2]
METVSQHITQLNHKNQELFGLENRINQLKQQLNLQQANNNILKTKVDKIVHSKKQKFYDEMKLKQILQSNAQNNDELQYTVQRNKALLNEEQRQSKQDMFDEKYLQTYKMKQKLDLEMLINQKKRDQQLYEKQQQYAKISEWEFNLKLNLKQREIDKIDKIRLEEKEFKEQLAQRMQQQQKICDQLSNEEQLLMNKLKSSQQFQHSLKHDLKTALNLSIKDYTNNTSVSIPTYFKSYSSSKIPLNSPYAQLPTMLKMKRSVQINKSNNNTNESLMKEYKFSLPSLYKPSIIEQQQQVERLFQSKSVKNSKSDLYQILHYGDSQGIMEKKSKFRTNQSEVIQNQVIKQYKQITKEQEQNKEQSNQEKQEIDATNQNKQEEQEEYQE